MKTLTHLLLACSMSAPAAAQLSLTYGPEDAPLGCPVHLTLSNDTDQPLLWDPCGFTVADAAGTHIFTPPCAGPVAVQPGEIFVHTWPQTDNAGNQVAPGTYFLGGANGPVIQVGTATTAITPLGAPKTGTARAFQLCSPQDPGAPFVLVASGISAPGIPTCGGVIPLGRDRLMRLSLTSPRVFRRFRGTLDATGTTTFPSFAIPDDGTLVGTRIVLAFLVLDPGAACRFRRISVPFEFHIR